MTRTLSHLIVLVAVAALVVYGGKSPSPVGDMPPPPPIPPPLTESVLEKDSPPTMEIQPTLIGNKTDIANTLVDIVEILGNETANASLETIFPQTKDDTNTTLQDKLIEIPSFTNDSQTNETTDVQPPLEHLDSILTQGIPAFVLDNETLSESNLTTDIGAVNDTINPNNITEIPQPSIDTAVENITLVNDSSSDHFTDVVKEEKQIKPSVIDPAILDMPPPPPVFRKTPSVDVKDKPGSTTIEITGIDFAAVTENNTEPQSVTTEAFPVLTTTNIPDSNDTTNIPSTFGMTQDISNISTAYETTTEPFKNMSDNDTDQIKQQHLPLDTQTPERRAPDLPPPIFVPKTPSSFPTGIKTDNVAKAKRTKKPSKVTAQPPPPPIIFKDEYPVPTSWVDPRIKQTTKLPVLPKETQGTKKVPFEFDPKFMSVSELAYFTLKQMERERQRKKAETAAKGMGVQVFFNTLQPFEEKRTTPKSSKADYLEPVVGSSNSIQLGDGHEQMKQTTQPPITDMTPLEQSPQLGKFFGADYLLSKLGIDVQRKHTTTIRPMVSPQMTPGHVKSFVPILTKTQLPKDKQSNGKPQESFSDKGPLTATEHKNPQKRIFFDANYLLNQIGLTTSRPQKQPVFNVPTLTTSKPSKTVFKQFYIPPNQKKHHIKPDVQLQTTPQSVIKPFPHEVQFRGTKKSNPWSTNFVQNAINQLPRHDPRGIQFQRRGQVHTRPIDLPTKTQTQPFTNYNINRVQPVSVTDNTKVNDITNRNVNNIKTPTQSLNGQFNVQYDPSGNVIRYIFGSAPVKKNSPLWEQTHSAKNLGMDLRAKFNKRLRRDKNTDQRPSWLQPPNSPVQYGTDDTTVKTHPEALINEHSQTLPRTGTDVRRDFNSHLLQELTKRSGNPVHPDSQSPSWPIGVHRFPLASKLGTDVQVSPIRTSALTSDLFQPMNFKTSFRTLTDKSKDTPSFIKHQTRPSGTQTHWKAPLSNGLGNNANVPYTFQQFLEIAPNVAKKSPVRYVFKTTSQSIESHTINKQATTPMTAFVPTTMPRRTTTSTTTLPTPPPTADPHPPPVFDTKVLQTFMPFPKPGETTAPTASKGSVGWGDNKTETSGDGSCSGCVFINDRCLLPDPKHCNLYIECVRHGRNVRAFNRECAIGAFFDRKSYLCVDPKIADCPTDRCREPGLKWYPVEGHCKHYWSCGIREGGSAFAQSECCPDMGGFKDGEGCVENHNCTDKCGSSINTNTPTGCKLRKTSSPTKYFDENAKLERPCAPGTLFNELQCTCIQDVTFERRENKTGGGNCTCANDTTCACRGATLSASGEPNCGPFLALTFDSKSIVDSSNTKQHIGVDGVFTTKAGEAIFNGGGKLVLWRYANLMIPLVFAVRLRFLPTSTTPRVQTLVANCDKTGAIEPTFQLSIDTLYNEVIFNVNTYDGQPKTFKIMYQPNEWTSVDLIYEGERIVGSVNRRSRNIFSGGGIETRPFPLAIGGCDTGNGFKGLMDDVYIYEQCIPDQMYGIFMSVLE